MAGDRYIVMMLYFTMVYHEDDMWYLVYESLWFHDGIHDKNYCTWENYLGNLIATNMHPYVLSGSLFQEIHSGGLKGWFILESHGIP